MAENTKIEWADHTWNPWIGCTKVGPPCDNCYAEALMDTRYGRVQWGPQGERVRTSASTWAQLRKWDRMAAMAGKLAFVFSLSLGDIWDNQVDPAWRCDAFDEARQCSNLVMRTLSPSAKYPQPAPRADSLPGKGGDMSRGWGRYWRQALAPLRYSSLALLCR